MEEKEESLEERLKAKALEEMRSNPRAEAAAKAYLRYIRKDKDTKKALQGFIELGIIGHIQKERYLDEIEKLEKIRDPEYMLKKAREFDKKIEEDVRFFIGKTLAKEGDENIKPSAKIILYTRYGEEYLENYRNMEKRLRDKNRIKQEMVYNSVKKITSTILNIPEDKINYDKNFGEDFGADSLDCVELIMEIEDLYKIEIADEDAENMLTVKDVVDYLMKEDIELK